MSHSAIHMRHQLGDSDVASEDEEGEEDEEQDEDEDEDEEEEEGAREGRGIGTMAYCMTRFSRRAQVT